MTDPTTIAFDAGTDAITAATEAATAQEIVRAADSDSLVAKIEEKMHEHAQQNAEAMTESITKIVSDALGRVKSRYVDTDRIPLLCQSVFEIKDDVKELKELMLANKTDSDKQHDNFVTKDGQYFIIRIIVFTGAGIVLTGALGAMLSFVFIKQ